MSYATRALAEIDNWKFVFVLQKSKFFEDGAEWVMSLFNYFKKLDKLASCAFKEVIEELQQHNALTSAVADVYLAANEKGSLSDLIGNAEKETGT